MKILKSKLAIFFTLFLSAILIVITCSTSLKADTKKDELTYTNRLLKNSFTEEEFRLFVTTIHAETKNTSYETKLAFANIILNRKSNNNYPNSIQEIIYEGGAFNSVKNGSLNKHLWEYDCGNFNTSEHKESIKAANNAINGTNNIGIRLYYNQYWPKLDYSAYTNSKIIDNHIFW